MKQTLLVCAVYYTCGRACAPVCYRCYHSYIKANQDPRNQVTHHTPQCYSVLHDTWFIGRGCCCYGNLTCSLLFASTTCCCINVASLRDFPTPETSMRPEESVLRAKVSWRGRRGEKMERGGGGEREEGKVTLSI